MREGTRSATDRDDLQVTSDFIANLLGTLGDDQASTSMSARSGSDADPFRAAQNQDLLALDADPHGGQGEPHGPRASAGSAEVMSATVKAQSRDTDGSAADRAAVPSGGALSAAPAAPASATAQDVVAAANQADDASEATPPAALPKGSHGHGPAAHRAKPASGGAGAAATAHEAAAIAGATPAQHPLAVAAPGAGAAGSTFVFQPGFGQETVTGFRPTGVDHDVLDLPSSEFATFAQVLSSTQDGADGAVIRDAATGDTLVLAGVTKAEIAQAKTDFIFHA